MKAALITCNAFVLLVVLSVVLVIEFRSNIITANIPFLRDASEFILRRSRIRYLKDEPVARKLQTVPHLLPGHSTGHHFNHSTGGAHKRAWMHFSEVDGLKNEEVVMFVMSSTIRNGYLLRERVIAGARTWMRLFANVVVVIEDTFEVRYALRHCELVDYDLYTTFVCHNEPTYLLSRNCTSEYYVAAGICCKVDESINYLVNVRPDFFKGIKYMLHSDDDTYWRPDQVLKWLAAVENSGVSKYPLISNVQIGDDNNKGVWMIQNCEEIHTSGWYQPTMMNHAALQRMAVAAAAYGNRDTCKAFDISQDVGIGIFAWLFGTNHIVMPGTNMNGDHKGIEVFQPTDVAIHYTKHHDEDRCDGKADNGWPAADRYAQNVVVGCGDIGHPVHGHDKNKRADMYDAWEYFKVHGKDITVNKVGENEFIEAFVVVDAQNKVQHLAKEHLNLEKNDDGTYQCPADELELIDKTVHKLVEGEKIVKRVVPRLMPMRGYDTTKHSKENDITKVWKPFTLQDCNPPGIKQH